MSKTFKTVLITAIITAVVIIGGKMLWDAVANFSLFGECGEEIIKEIKSPDGKHIAIAYIENCGATSSYSVGARIHWVDSGTVREEGAKIFSGYRSRYVDVEWINDKKLQVSYSVKDDNLLMQMKHIHGVDVVYKYEPNKETYR